MNRVQKLPELTISVQYTDPLRHVSVNPKTETL